MSLTNDLSWMSLARRQGRALDTWRDAARLVATRWEIFLDAEPETRAWAFTSYVAALDAERSAAAEVAGRVRPKAA